MTLAFIPLGEKTGMTIVENFRMDDKEMASGTHNVDGHGVVAFFQLGLELESTGSGRQRGADGTRWHQCT